MSVSPFRASGGGRTVSSGQSFPFYVGVFCFHSRSALGQQGGFTCRSKRCVAAKWPKEMEIALPRKEKTTFNCRRGRYDTSPPEPTPRIRRRHRPTDRYRVPKQAGKTGPRLCLRFVGVNRRGFNFRFLDRSGNLVALSDDVISDPPAKRQRPSTAR